MRIFVPLLLALTVVPLVELALLLTIGQAIGVPLTVALVIGTGLLGASLARAEGLKTFFEFQRQLSGGGIPAGPLADGAMILVAAAFLVTPGILTDAAGFSLLIPPIRAVLKKLLGKYFAGAVQVRTFDVRRHGSETAPTASRGADVIDADFERRD